MFYSEIQGWIDLSRVETLGGLLAPSHWAVSVCTAPQDGEVSAKKKKKNTLPLLLMLFYSPNLKSAWCKYLVAINGFRSVPQNAFISGIAQAKWSHWKSLSLTEGKGMKIRYWVNARPPLWTCGAIIKQEMQEEMLLSPPCCGYFSEKK